MANRYWVGGTATWDATVGTKWATTSGGGGGSAVPTAADDVYFDAASGAVTITTSGTTTDLCRSLDCAGFTGTLSHAASTTITIGDGTAGQGNIALKLVAGMTYTKGDTVSSRFAFVSTSATQQGITTAAKVLGSTTYSGAGGSWIFQDDFTANGSVTTIITHTAGTLTTNNKTVTTAGYTTSGTTTRTLSLGSSTLALTGQFSLGSTTNLTLDAGTSLISASGNQSFPIYLGGVVTLYDVTIASTGTGTVGITGLSGASGSSCRNLTITGPTNKTQNVTILYNLTITGTLTINGNSLTNRLLIRSDSVGTARTLTAAAVSLSNVDFRDITAAGVASPFTGTSIGNALGNTNITATTAVTRYWMAVSGGSWSATSSWAATSNGATGASVPLCHDTVVIDASSITSGARTITADMPRLGAGIDFTGVLNTPAFSMSGSGGFISDVFGSLTLIAGMTVTGTDGLDFRGRSLCTFTSAGLSIPWRIGVNTHGSTLSLGSNLTTTSQFDCVSGTFDANDFNLTTPRFGTSGLTITPAALMGNGTCTVNGTSTAWAPQTFSSFSAEGSTIIVSDTSATAKTFDGSALTYNIVTITGDNVTIAGSNTFATLNVNNAALTNGLKLTNGTTQTITSSFTTNGSAGNLAKLLSSTGGSAATLSKASGVVNVDYMSIQDSTATGGANWYAGANSTNVSNNSGWVFTAGPTSISVTDSVTVTENTAVTLSAIQINVSDSITVTENRLLVIAAVVNISDSITVTENVSVLIPQLFTTVSDSVTVTESTTVLIPTLLVSLSDSVTITENRQIIVTEAFGAFSSDIVTVSESLSVILSDPQINVSESIVITENSGLLLSVTINKSDSITVTENKNVAMISNVLVSDTITLSESRILQKLRGNKNRTSYTRIGKSTTPYSRATKSTTPYDR